MEYGLVVVWLAAFAWLTVAGLPVAAALCPRLADRGAGLALPVALTVLWVVAYWVGHLARVVDGLTFGYPALVAGLLVLGALDVLAVRRGVDIDWARYRRVMAVFAVAFLFLVWLRSLNPAAWPGGGEKFLDFGLLAALGQTTALPPEDVWFAGESELYYYGGHMLTALLARLTATPTVFAYNLGLAGFYAAFVSTAYGLAGAVGAARGRSYHAVGATAAVLVGVASNLATPVRLLVWLLPAPVGRWVAGAAGVELKGLALGPAQFNYWHAHLVIPGTNNEFPFFAWLNGDLHAHMMTMPFLLVVAGLLFSYYRTPAAALGRRRLLVASVVPLAGLMAASFTWAFPTVGGLVWLTLVFGPGRPADLWGGGGVAGRQGEAVRTVAAAVVAGVVLVGGAAVVAPFILATAGAEGIQGVGLLPDRSGLGPLVVVHGAFLSVSVLYLLDRLPVEADRRGWALLGGAWLLAVGVSTLSRASALVLFGPLLVGGWWLLRRTERVGFETVLLVAVSGLVVLTEFVYAKELAGPGRYNTVFKTYAQVWALWAVAAAAVFPGVGRIRATTADLLVRAARRLRGGPRRVPSGGRPERRQRYAVVFAVGLLLSVSVYAGFGVAWAVTTGRDDPTLDARDYVRENHPGEFQAIEWLADRPGRPTVVSAPGVEIYRWVNAPSSLTGLPTVAGWVHEVGYRGPDAYFGRVRAVDRLFNGTAERRAALIEEYDIDYVYVGPVERDRYGEIAFENESWVAHQREFGAVDLYVVD